MRLMARLKQYLRNALGDAVDLEARDSAA